MSLFKILASTNAMWIQIASAAIFCVTGCHHAVPVLEPTQVASVQRSAVRSHIPEHQVKVQWVRSGYGAGGGLIGALVDSGVNKGRSKAAEEFVKPLQVASRNIDFLNMYWQAVAPAIRQVPWIKSVGFAPSDAPLGEITDADVAQQSLVRMGTSYLLSVDCSTVLINSGIDFYAQGDTSQLGGVLALYRSEPIARVETEEQAVALWAQNNAARYAMALQEGVIESAKMVRMALLCMGGVNCPAGDAHHLRFRMSEGYGDYGSQVGKVDTQGAIFEEAPHRLIFRSEAGTFYSIPRSAIEEQEGHGPPPAPVMAVVPVAPPVAAPNPAVAPTAAPMAPAPQTAAPPAAASSAAIPAPATPNPAAPQATPAAIQAPSPGAH